MKLRHKLAKGGKVTRSYGKPAVMDEAMQRKDGGEVSVVGKKAGGRLDRARGGKIGGGSPEPHKGKKDVTTLNPAKGLGSVGKRNVDYGKPSVVAAAKKKSAEASKGTKGMVMKRSGGGVGSDKNPLSSAGGGGADKTPFSSAKV